MSIQILPARLANQIAAGEVVERPASVIKELVENSIDAGASDIYIEIDKGGHKRILIRDNGSGIPKDELGLALSRHATSKIKNIDDLEAITSLGFRGEALASISSVSRLVLSSKPQDQDQAWQAHCEGREMDIQLNPVAHPKGSSVEVVDLFFNTPARRKFLRAEKTEFQHIEEVFKRIALSHPTIGFTLKHNAKLIHKFNAVDEKLSHRRVAQVCGQAFISGSLEISGRFNQIEVSGWCCAVGEGRKTNDLQYSFINGRMMRDRVILHAIRQAFEGMIAPSTYPAFVIFISMPPDELDINVHPAKHEVRFHQSRLVHDLLFKSINEALLRTSADSNAQATSFDQHANHAYSNSDINHESKAIEGIESQTDGQTQGFSQGSEGQFQEPDMSYRSELQATPKERSYQINEASRSGSARGHAYRAPVPPTKAETQAYSELMSPSTPSLSNTRQHATEHAEGSVDKVNEHDFQWIFSPDQRLVFCQNDAIFILDAPIVFAQYFAHAMKQSDVKQPLLMPVSAQCKDPNLQGFLGKLGFDCASHAHKLVLKQVPACMRKFPWLSIFPNLLDFLQSQQAGLGENWQEELSVSELLCVIAQSICDTTKLHISDLQYCINMMPFNDLQSAIDQYAQKLLVPPPNTRK